MLFYISWCKCSKLKIRGYGKVIELLAQVLILSIYTKTKMSVFFLAGIKRVHNDQFMGIIQL